MREGLATDRILKSVRAALAAFWELIYPSNLYCICCNDFIDESQPYSLCDACVRKLHWILLDACPRCGKRVEHGCLCGDCRECERQFDQGMACVQYGSLEKKLIHRFKYKDDGFLGKKLATLMCERWLLEGLTVDFLVPVPMYEKKKQRRGYNQAEILAKELGVQLNLPCLSDMLLRIKETRPMNRLSKPDRQENVKNAFTIDEEWDKLIEGKSILLIDDVFTTGATADACSQCLRAHGAKSVYVLSFAAGAQGRSRD